MLYSPGQAAKDQLLADLLGVRSRLSAAWCSGAWSRGEQVCIMAAVNTEVGVDKTCTWQPADPGNPTALRWGRCVLAVYRALYGPKAPLDVSVETASRRIIQFNDHDDATQDSVVLLLDRAIEALQSGALNKPSPEG